MRVFSIVLLATAAVFSTNAAAATFSGARAEVRGGWDRMTLNLSYEDAEGRLSDSGHRSGFDLGAEVGYDVQAGPALVVGAYAGIEGSSAKACSPLVGNDSACLKLGRNFTVGARLGAKVSPLAMLYVKGGYSNGQLRASYENAEDPTLDFSDHANRGGYHFGVGGEMAVGAQGYVRAEYVRTNYNGDSYADHDFRVSLDGHRDQVLAGFGIRF